MGDLILLLWIIFSLVLAVAANARGRSPVGWFLISILFSPLLALAALLIIPDLGVEEARHDELVEAIATPRPADDPIERLERLAALRDKGAITPEEYEAKKAQLLERV